MKIITDKLATESLTLQHTKIWLKVKRSMDALHRNWTGVKDNYIKACVRPSRANMNHGNTFCTIKISKYSKIM